MFVCFLCIRNFLRLVTFFWYFFFIFFIFFIFFYFLPLFLPYSRLCSWCWGGCWFVVGVFVGDVFLFLCVLEKGGSGECGVAPSGLFLIVSGWLFYLALLSVKWGELGFVG